MKGFTEIEGCRSCGSRALDTVMDFGAMPLADALLNDPADAETERWFPQTLVFCNECALVQLRETVLPQFLYGSDYPYFSSFSDHLVEHSRRHAEDLVDRYSLGHHSRVVEIASNDGYLLQWFQAAGVPVLGIDPADGPSRAARQRGIETISDYFGRNLADRLRSEGIEADVVIGNNVLAHVPDQNELVDAMRRILRPGGSVVMEFPYVRDLVEHNEFDTIYHEHHCYFSIGSVKQLFSRHGLHLNRVERIPIHGGSLRVHFSERNNVDPAVDRLLSEETELGMDFLGYYTGLAVEAERIRDELVSLLQSLKDSGNRIAAYAAAAKGAVLLNYSKHAAALIDYVVDRNTHKQGRYMPGVHLPILDPDVLLDDLPEYLLILAWNFKEEIMEQQVEFEAAGGHFMVPIPTPTIVTRSATSR